MRNAGFCKSFPFLILIAVLLASVARAETPFTYQGQLAGSGTPHNGTVEMTFRLWDAPTGGTQIGGDITQSVEVVDGLFQVVLDFGSVFDGSFLAMEIEVEGTILEPRQPVFPVPMALLAIDVLPGQFWRQGGNAGTAPGDFLGTTDNAPFEVHAGGRRAIRIEPGNDNNAPNTISGYGLNSAGEGVVGATIGGGGRTINSQDQPNTVSQNYGAIGGGVRNTTGSFFATVAGGINNTAAESRDVVAGGSGNLASGGSSAVVGGNSNTASGSRTLVGGGQNNVASGNAATVAGGLSNSAGGALAAIPGGRSNAANGSYSFAAGFRARAEHHGSFVWGDSTNADFESASTDEFSARATGGVRFVVGDGGWHIQPGADGDGPNLVAGHAINSVADGVLGATIAGGGGTLSSVELPNTITSGNYATISGGSNNTVSAGNATVGGGVNHTVLGLAATISGGQTNAANGWNATIAGGEDNFAHGSSSTVGGGSGNSINSLSAYATIPGGRSNLTSADYTFAAGRRARAIHEGAFVWADATDADFESTGDNQFLVRAAGGSIFDSSVQAVEMQLTNRSAGDHPQNPERWTLAAIRQDGSAIPELHFHGPEHQVIGDPGSVFKLEAVSGQATFGRADKSMDLTVRGQVTAHERVRLMELDGSGNTDLCLNTGNYIASCSSSRRYKQDIADLDDAMALVDRLRPVRYRWKDSGMEDIGLVAEEVAEIEPRLVTFDSEGRIEGVKYRQVGAVLIRALQEQQEHAARMQAELADLRARAERVEALAQHNALLEARLARLEAQMQVAGKPSPEN